MKPMPRLMALRIYGVVTGAVLAVWIVLSATAQIVRPDFHATNLFVSGVNPPGKTPTLAATTSPDGEIRSDVAAVAAAQALKLAPGPAAGRTSNTDAQKATVAALDLSPVNSLMWLTLGLLKIQAEEPATVALKTSYLTGPVPRSAALIRLRAVATTNAASDEEIGLLARSDVRKVLSAPQSLDPAFITIYRQASRDGRSFLLEAAASLDPYYRRALKPYQ